MCGKIYPYGKTLEKLGESMVKVDYLSYTGNYVTEDDIKQYYGQAKQILKVMDEKKSMLDWVDIESTISQQEIDQIKSVAAEIRDSNSILIVVGVGGSYLGAKAVIDAFKPYFGGTQNVVFAGYNLSSNYLSQLLRYMEGKSVYINIISKSGNTMEPRIAFDFLFDKLKKWFPQDYQKRVIATTDKESGSLRKIAESEGFRTFCVPRNIGGRYSVLSAVGLLPIAVAGIDIDKLLLGAKVEKKQVKAAVDYAIARHVLFKKGFMVEAFTSYEQNFEGLALWRQQLYGETQGKDKQGILPINNSNTTNLHSIGQYFQEGPDILFESVLKIDNGGPDLRFLGKSEFSLQQLNKIALTQVAVAHIQGNTPSIIIGLEDMSPKSVGEFIYFNLIAAAVGGYLLGQNPFDQPGVESYKALVNHQIEGIDIFVNYETKKED